MELKTMDMLQVFHMNKGQGEASYAMNCTVQNKIISLTKAFVEEAIQGYLSNDVPETMVIADLGCSSGPTALGAVSEIINMVKARCRKMEGHCSSSLPEFMVYLNDLPGNDFNGVFGSLPNFHKKLKETKSDDFEPSSCFVAGLPGSFYERLLPNKTLHFVHSSSSLHWLSQVPEGFLDDKEKGKMVNKGKIYMSKSSPKEVIEAYKLQFRKDFISFLKCRAEEVISGGRMVLTFMGRRSSNNHLTCLDIFYPWELIANSLTSMVSEGLIEEDKVDNFNVPYYAPCLEEVKQLVEEESSFFGHRFEAIEVEWDGEGKSNNNNQHSSCKATALAKGERVAKIHRAVCESMFEHYFGKQILDDLFQRYIKVLEDHFTNNPNSKMITLVISLIRN